MSRVVKYINPIDFGFPCSNCGEVMSSPEAAYICQGAAPDLCLERLCEGCKQSCYSCSLPVCAEHQVVIAGDRWCCQCVALMVEEAEREMAEELEAVNV